MQVPYNLIFVSDDRQRKTLTGITELAESIKQHGLITPLCVTLEDGKYKLVAGERRYRAIGTLGWPEVTVNLFESLSKTDQEIIELEENVRREDLPWPDRINATARLVEAYSLPQSEAALKLQIPIATLSKMITLASGMKSNPKLSFASSWTSAYQALIDQQKKQSDATFESILGDVGSLEVELDAGGEIISVSSAGRSNSTPSVEATGSTPSAEPPASGGVPVPSNTYAALHSFLDWAPTYEGKRFNLIHCDFPYGLNMDTANLQGSSVRWDATDGRYSDSPELFDDLVEVFFEKQNRFVADSAHCIFWLAHKNFGKIWSRFKYFGWIPCEVPLIWHKSDGKGIAPDPRRQPRRTYEIAVFASRGDRTIAKVKDASFSSPTTKEHHLSEKPLAVVTHFLEMCVDETTEILDPTCGSGTALEAALRLGASRALGLDVLPEHVAYTNRRCAAISSADYTLDSLGIDL